MFNCVTLPTVVTIMQLKIYCCVGFTECSNQQHLKGRWALYRQEKVKFNCYMLENPYSQIVSNGVARQSIPVVKQVSLIPDDDVHSIAMLLCFPALVIARRNKVCAVTISQILHIGGDFFSAAIRWFREQMLWCCVFLVSSDHDCRVCRTAERIELGTSD